LLTRFDYTGTGTNRVESVGFALRERPEELIDLELMLCRETCRKKRSFPPACTGRERTVGVRALREGCPERWSMPHPWRCPRPGWTGSEQPDAVEDVPAHGRGVGLDGH